MPDGITYLVDRLHWFAYGLGLNETTLREIIRNVSAEMHDAPMDVRITEIRRRVLRTAGF